MALQSLLDQLGSRKGFHTDTMVSTAVDQSIQLTYEALRIPSLTPVVNFRIGLEAARIHLVPRGIISSVFVYYTLRSVSSTREPQVK